jgi:hypothetical protein
MAAPVMKLFFSWFDRLVITQELPLNLANRKFWFLGLDFRHRPVEIAPRKQSL